MAGRAPGATTVWQGRPTSSRATWTLLRQRKEHHGQVLVWILLHFGRVDAAAHKRVRENIMPDGSLLSERLEHARRVRPGILLGDGQQKCR